MILFFLLGMAVSTAASAPHYHSPKIVGGTEITIENAPYTLQMEYAFWGSIWSFVCGGVVIDDHSVLTAGHCVTGDDDNIDVRLIRFRSGSTELGNGTIHNVTSIVKHPEYQDMGGYSDYDIAFLTVSPPFEFDETTRPILTAKIEPIDGDNCTITGWGASDENIGIPESILRSATIPYVIRTTCAAEYRGEANITENMICAGLTEGGIDSCSGDSGGPFVVNGILAGLVSFGKGCAEPGFPGVYTNVAKFYDWIHDQRNQKIAH